MQCCNQGQDYTLKLLGYGRHNSPQVQVPRRRCFLRPARYQQRSQGVGGPPLPELLLKITDAYLNNLLLQYKRFGQGATLMVGLLWGN